MKRTKRRSAKYAVALGRICPLLTVLLLVLLSAGWARAEGEDAFQTPECCPDTDEMIAEEIRRLAESTDLSGWQSWFDSIKGISPKLAGFPDVKSFVRSLAAGADTADEAAVFPLLKDLLLPGFRAASAKLTTAAAAALLTGVCGIVFAEGGTKRSVQFMLCAAAMLPVTALFADLVSAAVSLISDIAAFASACAPVLTVLLAAMGCSAGAGLLSPRLSLIADGITMFIRGVIMPLIIANGITAVTGVMSSSIRIDRLRSLMGKTVKWLLAACSVIFTAGTVIGGAAAGAADGISIRTARFAIDRLIPSVGSLVNGAVDAVRAGATLFKNAAGTAALIILAGIAVRPLMTIAAGMLSLRLLAAIAEPVADERIPRLLDGIADTASLLFAGCAAVCSMLAVLLTAALVCGASLAGL